MYNRVFFIVVATKFSPIEMHVPRRCSTELERRQYRFEPTDGRMRSSTALLGILVCAILVGRCSSNPFQTSSITCPTSSTPSLDAAFDDNVSRTFASRFVFDGMLVRQINGEPHAVGGSPSSAGQRRRVPMPSTASTDSPWTGEFRINAILKKESEEPEDESEGDGSTGGPVSVGSLVIVTTCPVSSESTATRPTVGGRYVVFVGDRLLSGTTSGSAGQKYLSLGFPEKFTKKVAQLVKENGCADCGE